MNTKRKLMTTIASLGIFVILAGVALGVALAALSGNVTSGFTISYTANNVSAAIFGAYGSGKNYTAMTSGSNNYIHFNGDEKGDGARKNFDTLEDISLTAANPSVSLRYRLFNFSQQAMPISINLTGDMENLKIDYTANTFNGTNVSTVTDSTTSVPFSKTAEVTYSGFENMNALMSAYPSIPPKEVLSEVLQGETNAEAYTIMMTQGYQAAFDYYNDFLFDEFLPQIENVDFLDESLKTVFAIFSIAPLSALLHFYTYDNYIKTGLYESPAEIISTLEINDEFAKMLCKYIYLTEMGEELDDSMIDDDMLNEMKDYFKTALLGSSATEDLTLINLDYLLSLESMEEYVDYLLDIFYPSNPIQSIATHMLYYSIINEDYESFFNLAESNNFSYREMMTDGEYMFLRQYYGPIIYSLYGIFMEQGYDRAKKIIDDILAEIPNDWSGNNSEGIELLENLSAELQTLKDAPNGKEQAKAKQEEYSDTLEMLSYFYQNLFESTSNIDDAIVESGEVPYTEIIITISIDKTNANAHLNNGKLEFILGNV